MAVCKHVETVLRHVRMENPIPENWFIDDSEKIVYTPYLFTKTVLVKDDRWGYTVKGSPNLGQLTDIYDSLFLGAIPATINREKIKKRDLNKAAGSGFCFQIEYENSNMLKRRYYAPAMELKALDSLETSYYFSRQHPALYLVDKTAFGVLDWYALIMPITALVD